MKYAAIGLSCLMLGACSTSPPRENQMRDAPSTAYAAREAGEVNISVVRDRGPILGLTARISVDGERVVDIEPSEVATFSVKAGKRRICAEIPNPLSTVPTFCTVTKAEPGDGQSWRLMMVWPDSMQLVRTD